MSSNSVCSHTRDEQIGLPLRGYLILLITRMITDRIGLHSVLLPLLNGTEYYRVLHNLEKVSDTVFEYFLLQLWWTNLFTIKQYITHFSSSYYLQIIFFIKVSFYLFFHLDVIHRLPFSISMLFNRLPFLISTSFTGSLFRFPCYLQAPFFDFHVIKRLPFSISILFTNYLFHKGFFLPPFSFRRYS